jgi:hypothetical protein
MATIKAVAGPNWRDTFNELEMQFFGIAAPDWRLKSREKIIDIHETYDIKGEHTDHVARLNDRLKPDPELVASDFDSKITLIGLRENVLARRMPPDLTPSANANAASVSR